MRAYRRFRKRTSLRYCVYLTEVERADLLAELLNHADVDSTPALSRLERHLGSPREDGGGMGGEQ